MRLSSGSQPGTLLKCPWVKCWIPKQLRQHSAATFDLWPLRGQGDGRTLIIGARGLLSEKQNHILSLSTRSCATGISCIIHKMEIHDAKIRWEGKAEEMWHDKRLLAAICTKIKIHYWTHSHDTRVSKFGESSEGYNFLPCPVSINPLNKLRVTPEHASESRHFWLKEALPNKKCS